MDAYMAMRAKQERLTAEVTVYHGRTWAAGATACSKRMYMYCAVQSAVLCGQPCTFMSAVLNMGGPSSMLIMMMAIITVWKEDPQSVKAVPAIRARPMATPA